MSRYERSMPAAYFDDLYAGDRDPWRFATSVYERDKYAATLEALPRPHYASALEIGCSIGVLTRQLAARCEALLSLDVAKVALDEAALRCADLPHVRFELCRVPGAWPGGRYDLVVLSEVVYYLDRADIDVLAARVRGSLAPKGDIVLVHWLGETHYPLTGDEAAGQFVRAAAGWSTPMLESRTSAYRLDVLRGHS